MQAVRIKQVDVFTNTSFSGNPAGVVTEAGQLSEEQMQKIAREMNLSETAFISKPAQAGADYQVRFFTPQVEVPLCGHATIAAFHVLAEEGQLFLREPVTTVNQETKAGILPVELKVEKLTVTKIMMNQNPPSYEAYPGSVEELASFLAIEAGEIKNTSVPLQIVSTGLPVLIVPVKHLEVLEQMQPQLSWLKERKLVVYAFSLETVSPLAMAHGRCFAPSLGINEDPATGIASGALGAYLIKNKVIRGNSPVTFVAEQGHALGRPSEILVEIHFSGEEVETVKVGGSAVTVLEGEIYV